MARSSTSVSGTTCDACRCRASRPAGCSISAASTLVVSPMHDEAIAAHVRQGSSLLLLPDENMSLYPFFPHWQNVRVANRDGTLWRGDWASSFAWLRRTGSFAGLPSGPLLDETFDRVIPA